MDKLLTDRDRLADLASLHILDTPPEPEFDSVVRAAAAVAGTDAAAISLVAAHRQWFKASIGIDFVESPRASAFCDHAIAGDEALVVTDALSDARFAENPLVLGAPHVRFYAGHPIHSPGGHRVGSLCVLDTTPRVLEPAQLASLRALADHVEVLLQKRLDRLPTSAAGDDSGHHRALRLEALGRLAGGVAHDFNNLLTVILGYSELLALDTRLPADVQDELREVANAGTRAKRLTRQLLAFGRRQVLRPKALDVAEVVRGSLPLLRRMVRPGVELQAVSDAAPWRIHADRVQLEQILINLTVNASDAMPRGGRIEVRSSKVREPIEGVRIDVIDEGEGMTAEVRRRLFETFFTTKEEGRGTGLGLATVHGIVEQSGGRLIVHSEPGRGTTMSVILPRTTDASVEPPRSGIGKLIEERGDALGGTERILVVDDDAAVRVFMAKVLRRAGYTVLESGTPGDALLIVEKASEPIDLVVSDVVMRRMSGPEMVHRIRERWPDVGVVHVSGYSSQGVPVPDGVPHLDKPIAAAELLGTIRTTLDDR